MAWGIRLRSNSRLIKTGFFLSLLMAVAPSCDSGLEQSPPVVVVQAAKTGQTVRVCPKCHRRFFGEQRSCTVDGSELMDFHEEPVKAAPMMTEADGAVEVGAANEAGLDDNSSALLNDALSNVGGTASSKTASLPKKAVVGAQAIPAAAEPKRVKVNEKVRDKWDSPPSQGGKAAAMAVLAPPKKTTPVTKPTQTVAPQKKERPPAKVVAALPPARPPEELLASLFLNGSASSVQANKGQLSPAEVAALKTVPINDETKYTKSRLLLATQYKATGNTKAYGGSLSEMLQIPSNQYNPTIRLEEAEYHLLQREWEKAIGAGTTAERYRQKFPRGEVYYSRLARTYEVLAKSYEGRFTSSENPDDLDLAIRMWQRYLTHVEKKTDKKRIKLANEQITKLERIKERVL